MLCPRCSRQSVLSRSFSFEVQMSLLLSGLSYHGQMPTQNRALIERGPGCNVVRKCFVVSLVINTRARIVTGSIVPEHICIAVLCNVGEPGKDAPVAQVDQITTSSRTIETGLSCLIKWGG